MAQTVHLELEIDGNKIDGESTVASMDRADTIECSTFSYAVTVPQEAGSRISTGRRQHGQVKVHKRIDKSTPLLIKAVCNNEPVTKAVFRFYRPWIDGRGTEQHYYTVELADGYVVGVSQVSRDAVMAGESAGPMMEEVCFNFLRITWTYESGGIIHSDSWDNTQ